MADWDIFGDAEDDAEDEQLVSEMWVLLATLCTRTELQRGAPVPGEDSSPVFFSPTILCLLDSAENSKRLRSRLDATQTMAVHYEPDEGCVYDGIVFSPDDRRLEADAAAALTKEVARLLVPGGVLLFVTSLPALNCFDRSCWCAPEIRPVVAKGLFCGYARTNAAVWNPHAGAGQVDLEQEARALNEIAVFRSVSGPVRLGYACHCSSNGAIR